MKAGHENPVNSTAARVMATGTHFEYGMLESEVCSPLPLPMKEVLPQVQDLTGHKFGRLTVIGLGAVKKRWVCRCICGNYVLRRAAAIKAGAPDAACNQCHLMAVSRRLEFERRTGKFRETKDFMR